MSAARILVVEDNSADIFLLRRALAAQPAPFELEVVSDGEKALSYVTNHWGTGDVEKPCVILLDLHLPKENGIDVLRGIRANPNWAHVHVVVVTSAASPREEAELRGLGSDYRLKPKSLAEFTTLADDLIAICRGLKPATK